ncbi:Bowman-Birk type trypsin inhibitor-like isoform X1 [Zingiber officinale]|uniref:Bowman-Birk serine protease inhibitors family domain-containing protein n=1 Tax=Zingiber officinale TaxID=94328 RepID=A0A8J5FV79_ZINOF|nr:Bowman-Birk type trypsin inhibitor-like isoform X1 [Zingiber officinale]KAG6486281.1 hypothetical protein ZIOFF_054851 [Zingiber officinale]
MKHNLAVLVMLLSAAAAAAATATLPELKGHETGAAAEQAIRVRRTWPCCDRCGGCATGSDAPECQCHDLVRRCHPSCRSCVRSPLSVEPPLFYCSDRIPGYCQRRCNSGDSLQIH